MFKNVRIAIAQFLARDHIKKLEDNIQKEIDQRVAEAILKIDPFEFLMKEFHGVFSEMYEHPEENLNEAGKIGIEQWGWMQKRDPHFQYLTDWIVNTQGNITLRHAEVTPERILYGRAQIGTILLFKKEVGRLASLYEDRLEKSKNPNFDPNENE